MAVRWRTVLGGCVVAAGLAGFSAAQPPGKANTPGKATSPDTPDPVRAADPLGAMLADGKASYAKLRDYGCTFTRQERVNGALSAEQVGEMKVRVQPYSVYVRFARPEAVAGLEMCHVAGKRADDKMRYRPAGVKGVNGFVSISTDDPKLRSETRHPANELGVGRVLEQLTTIANREKGLNNPVEVFTSDYKFAGKDVTRYEIFTRRPHAHRYAYQMVVYVDKETKLPLRFEAYDQPKAGATTGGDLLEAYSYTDVRTNVGLGDNAFDY